MGDNAISEQLAYYRARAAEYDQWFYRRGRYDRGEKGNQLWFDEVATLRRELDSMPPCDSILELACGTGIWTKPLAAIGRQVTAIDASPEVLEINRCKVDSPSVRYLQADLFSWQPGAEYDLVFFSFWLSHVPPEKLDPFLDAVSRATKPGGRIFAIDSLPDDLSTAVDHPPKQPDRIYETRKLNDGRQFTIVKVYYQPAPLEAAFARHGLEAQVRNTGRFFWYALARK